MIDRFRFVLWILGCFVIVLLLAPPVRDAGEWIAGSQAQALFHMPAQPDADQIRGAVLSLLILVLLGFLAIVLLCLLGLWLRLGLRLWRAAWPKQRPESILDQRERHRQHIANLLSGTPDDL